MTTSTIGHADPPARIEWPTTGAFRLGDCLVEPSLGRIRVDGLTHFVEPKTMDVLVVLVGRPGEVVSSDELIDSVWRGRPMGDNPVHKCVSTLRSALGDNARHPHYIATIPRKGYRLLVPCEPIDRDIAMHRVARPIRFCIDIWPPVRMSAPVLRSDDPAALHVARRSGRIEVTLRSGAGEAHITAQLSNAAAGGAPSSSTVCSLDIENLIGVIHDIARAVSISQR